tara:strand:- start:416 stop:577 length:162 start_codon:yes stop_codon:yes gene_type:complete
MIKFTPFFDTELQYFECLKKEEEIKKKNNKTLDKIESRKKCKKYLNSFTFFKY